MDICGCSKTQFPLINSRIGNVHLKTVSGSRIIFIVFTSLVMSLDGYAYFRYALVIGNNNGVDDKGETHFSDLKKAEEEAEELYRSLIRLANFREENIILLQGTSRSEVMAAVKQLKNKMESDSEKFGYPDTLFAIFFTGHGLNGQLLVYESSLTAEDINIIFKEDIDATVEIGFFDACFSGGMLPKGMNPHPNLLREIPQDTLYAEGSAWFVSSGENQLSYEDQTYGGVFTHFLIEAMEEGELNGPGITLNQIWSYISSNTISYTSDSKHTQTPGSFFDLKTTGLFHFSFPTERSSSLILQESLEGDFLLDYFGVSYSETFSKLAGEEKIFAVFPGEAKLTVLNSDTLSPYLIEFQEGQRTVISDDTQNPAALGEEYNTLISKGKDSTINAVMVRPKLNLMLGLQLELSIPELEILAPYKVVGLGLRINRGAISAGISMGYGYGAEDLGSWSYKVHMLKGSAHLGYGLDFDLARLSLGGSVSVSKLWEIFNNGDKQSGTSFAPAVRIGFIYPTNKSFMFEIAFDTGTINSTKISQSAERQWDFYMNGSLWFGYLFY